MADISPDVLRLARGHVLESDESFMLAIATALSNQGPDARRAEVIAEASAERMKELIAERDAATAEGRRIGASEERQRIQAILSAKEAKNRRSIAETLAFKSEMPAFAAIEALKIAPEEARNFVLEWQASESHVVQPQEADSAPCVRAADALGGLVAHDPSTPAGVVDALVAFDPTPPQTASEKKDAMWKKAIAGINEGSSKQPAATSE